MPIVHSFVNDPITFTYVHSDAEPDLSKQFGINDIGAVIYKPKRGKYIEIGVDSESPLVDPQALRSFVDGAMNGGAQAWLKLDD